MNIKERNAALIEAVELTEEELKEAITEAKKKKYFHNKHKDYWLCTAHVEKDRKIEKQVSALVVEESDVKLNQ